MSIERTYYCDGPAHTEFPEGELEQRLGGLCPAHARTAGSGLPHGFIRIVRGRGEYGEPNHFCGWGCVMRFAADMPVPEIVTLEDLEKDGDD